MCARAGLQPIFFNPFCLQYRPARLRLSFRFSEPVNPAGPGVFLFAKTKKKRERRERENGFRSVRKKRGRSDERFFGYNEADLHRPNFYLDLFRH